MAVIKFKNTKPKVIFGIIIPNAIFELFNAVPDRNRATEIIKMNFGIDPNRLITLEQPMLGDQVITLLVLYDKMITSNERYIYPHGELENFNFPIFEYDRINMASFESLILTIKGEHK